MVDAVTTDEGKGKRGRKAKSKPEPHPLEQSIGCLVKYYSEGWRYGYLEDVVYGLTEAKAVVIRSISAYKAVKARRVDVPINEITIEPERR